MVDEQSIKKQTNKKEEKKESRNKYTRIRRVMKCHWSLVAYNSSSERKTLRSPRSPAQVLPQHITTTEMK